MEVVAEQDESTTILSIIRLNALSDACRHADTVINITV